MARLLLPRDAASIFLLRLWDYITWASLPSSSPLCKSNSPLHSVHWDGKIQVFTLENGCRNWSVQSSPWTNAGENKKEKYCHSIKAQWTTKFSSSTKAGNNRNAKMLSSKLYTVHECCFHYLESCRTAQHHKLRQSSWLLPSWLSCRLEIARHIQSPNSLVQKKPAPRPLCSNCKSICNKHPQNLLIEMQIRACH